MLVDQKNSTIVDCFRTLCMQDDCCLNQIDDFLFRIPNKLTFLTTKDSSGMTIVDTLFIFNKSAILRHLSSMLPGLSILLPRLLSIEEKIPNKDLRAAANILSLKDTKNVKFEGMDHRGMTLWFNEIFNNEQKSNKEIKQLFSEAKDELRNVAAGWIQHSIGVSFYKNLMVYCNTGQGANSNNLGVIILPVTKQQKSSLLSFFAANIDSASSSTWFAGFEEILGAKFSCINSPKNHENECLFIKKSAQKNGNCVKSNNTKVLEGVISLLLFSRSCNENNSISIRELQAFHKKNAKKIKTLYKKISTQLRQNAITLIIEHIQLFDRFPSEIQHYIMSICVNYFTQHQLREKSRAKSHIFKANIMRIYDAVRFGVNQNIQALLRNLMSMQGVLFKESSSVVSAKCLNDFDGPSIVEVFSDDEDDVSDVASDHTLAPNN